MIDPNLIEPEELSRLERLVQSSTPLDPENVPRLVHTVRQLWEALAVLADERPRFVGGLPDQDPIPPLGDCCMHDRRYGPTDLKGVTVTIEAVDPEAFKKKIGEISGRGAIAKALGLPRATFDANGSPVEEASGWTETQRPVPVEVTTHYADAPVEESIAPQPAREERAINGLLAQAGTDEELIEHLKLVNPSNRGMCSDDPFHHFSGRCLFFTQEQLLRLHEAGVLVKEKGFGYYRLTEAQGDHPERYELSERFRLFRDAKVFDDAGQGEHNVLALIDHYQRNSMEADERLRAVERRLKKAEDVVMLARQLTSYAWEDRLDDCKVSDEAKHDSRELSIAIWHYDQGAKE